MKQLVMRLTQIYEFIKQNGLLAFLHEVCYLNRVAVVVEKNLNDIDTANNQTENASLKVVELQDDILNSGNYSYVVNNRYLKAVQYMKKGCGGYAIIKDNKILGDIWCALPKENNNTSWHSDCKLLRINCMENQVYTFDMFLSPEERGNNLSLFLQTSALKGLREKGFTKAYGYYWGDNMPALWTHRLGKWKEINRLKVHRFLFFKKAFV